jgi:sugar lactone lactonase YvrE
MTGPRAIGSHQVTPAACAHGEGPVWDERDGVLRFVDLTRGDVMTFDPRRSASGPESADALRRVHVADVVAALRPRTSGGWVLALERGFALTEPGSWRAGALIAAFTDPAIRMNDGGCDPGGGFLCGSMAYTATTGAGSLYRLAPDGSVSEVLAGVTISNGFCVDPIGSLAYYIDTPTRRIDVFDLASDGATLEGRRPFVHIEPGAGLPDGLTVDADGGVWVALYGGSAVRRYLPDGRLDTVVTVPTPHVTAPAFGGAGLRDLYITTSQEGIDVAADRLAGSLFHAEPGPRGLPPRPYAG